MIFAVRTKPFRRNNARLSKATRSQPENSNEHRDIATRGVGPPKRICQWRGRTRADDIHIRPDRLGCAGAIRRRRFDRASKTGASQHCARAAGGPRGAAALGPIDLVCPESRCLCSRGARDRRRLQRSTGQTFSGDVGSGPLLRISDDRFLPGLERLTECVRRASNGETKLFIQIIDFLSIRRRPTAQKYFERFLTVTARHRELLQMPAADEASVRTRLAALNEAELARALTARELESLRLGFRERVTDTGVAAVRDLPATLPAVFAAAAGRAPRA